MKSILAAMAISFPIAAPAVANDAEYRACLELLNQAEEPVNERQREAIGIAVGAARETDNRDFLQVTTAAREAQSAAISAWAEYQTTLREICAEHLKP